ncbi:hypothetical protein F25303_10119 [Fusarium sp. NRRL 25303]|nr:hypothetical protein F25303_10119 [Fusarium sp. NRRL 25303]
MPRLSNREKRQARFAAAQDSLTSEELEKQKEQDIKVAQKPLAYTTLYTLKLSKKWFIEFMENEHPEVETQVELFAPDSHDQDYVLLKESKPSLVTPAACGAQWSENPTESNPWDLQRQMSSFIPNDLAIQEVLTTEAKPKLSASSKDASFIVSKLYEPEYLGTFGSMPTVLNLTLYMMLVIDWLNEPTEWRTHAGRHLNEALSIVSTIGYSGISVGRTLVPQICPLCIHNETAPSHQLVFTYCTFWDL